MISKRFKIDFEAGETLETTKRDLIDSVIGMSQSSHGNKLVHARPLPKPAPVPARVNPTQTDPNAPPQLQLSDFVEEIPYEIAIRGNYVSINEFVNELSRKDVVVEVSQMEVKPEREGQSFADPTKPIKSTFKINFFIKKS